MTANGLNFEENSLVRWNNDPRPTLFISDQQLVASIFASDITSKGTAAVTVTTSRGQISNSLTFTIACNSTITPSSQTFPASGGTGTVGVVTTADCEWTATSNSFFITITSGAAGTGNGTLSYSVAANTSTASRTGTLNISGQIFTVTQAGTSPIFLLSPSPLTFRFREGGVRPTEQFISISSDPFGLAFTATTSVDGGPNWLKASPTSGIAPTSLFVGVNPAGLPPGSYQGTVTVNIANASPSLRTVPVRLTIDAGGATLLGVQPDRLSFSFVLGSAERKDVVTVFNQGGGSLDFRISATTSSGGSWLRVSRETGTATLSSPVSVSITANPAGLGAGTYTGRINVTSSTTRQSTDIPVTMTVSAIQQSILLSQDGLTFTAVAKGGALPPQTFGVLNRGQGVMDWSVSTTTSSGGPNWLTATPVTGSADASSFQVPLVSVSANHAGLAPGEYYGQVRVLAPGASNSPQIVSVLLNVLPSGSNPGPLVRPTGLIFAVPAGETSLSPQEVSVSNLTGTATSFGTGTATLDGGSWFDYIPRSGTIAPNQAARIVILPRLSGLSPGLYRGALTLVFADGTLPQVINILLVIGTGSPGAALRQRRGEYPSAEGFCTPERLHAVVRVFGTNFYSAVSWGVTLEVQVSDSCGQPVPNAVVVGGFSNGDQMPPLVSRGNGVYTGTWRPGNSTGEVTVTVRALLPPLQPAEVEVKRQVSSSSPAPVVFSGGIVNGASFVRGGPIAPGAIISIFGRNLAGSISLASRLPLETSLGGVTLTVGDRNVPLFYASEGQVNAQLPFDLKPGSGQQAIVKVRQAVSGSDAITVPETIDIAEAQPAIFTANRQGTGQGTILNEDYSANSAGNPANRGSIIQVFCTGLGATDPSVASGQPAPSSPLAQVVVPLEAQIGGLPATVHFAGLAPGFVGLYQVNVRIPSGAEPGPAVPLVFVQKGSPSNTVTLAIR